MCPGNCVDYTTIGRGNWARVLTSLRLATLLSECLEKPLTTEDTEEHRDKHSCGRTITSSGDDAVSVRGQLACADGGS